MNRFLCILLLGWPFIAFADSQGSPTVDSCFGSTGVDDQLEIVSDSPDYTSISLRSPHVKILNLTLDGEAFQLPVLEGEAFRPVNGAPAVPQITRFYQIPATGDVELRIGDSEFQVIQNFRAYPYHELEAVDWRTSSVYQENAWYPPEIAAVSEPMILRDFRVVAVTLNPVQINPITRQARIYQNIEVELIANNSPGINELLSERQVSHSNNQICRSLIRNLDEHALDDEASYPGGYLFIAKDEATTNRYVDSLAQWKRRKGYDVHIERRYNWTSTAMQSYIRDYYDSAEAPLEYVCLVGDPTATNGVPTDGTEYDHIFSLTAGDDELPDIAVGRLSTSTTTELVTVLRKILSYESDPWMEDTEWFTKSLLYANTNSGAGVNWVFVQWMNEELQRTTGFSDNFIDWSNNGTDYGVIMDRFREGIGLFNYSGYWIGQFPNTTAGFCSTGYRLPICILTGEGTGDFQWGLGLSESFLVAGTPVNLKGGVCGIGCVGTGQWLGASPTFTSGFIQAMGRDSIEHVGDCLNAGKLKIAETYGLETGHYNAFAPKINLMGDPALSIWTDVPVILNVDHPESLAVGSRSLIVTVTNSGTGEPVRNALVVAWKEGESYERVLTDEMGQAALPVIADSLGHVLLTITKRNHKPYLYSIPCFTPQDLISVESVLLEDNGAGGTHGNADGILNPTEVVDLIVAIKNCGVDTVAAGSQAVLISDDPMIEVISEASSFADIPPGAQVETLSPFRIEANPNLRNGQRVALELRVFAAQDTFIDYLELFCEAGEAVYVEHRFSGRFRPGTTSDVILTLSNAGNSILHGIQAELVSRSGYITIIESTFDFGDINPGENVEEWAFEVGADSEAFPGQEADMWVFLSNETGFRDTLNVVFQLYNAETIDPSGPDEFGYYAFDNTDSLYDQMPEYEYLYASNGINLDLDDDGEQGSANEIWTSVRTLPFDFTFYGETFDHVTICSNGWLAFGDQGWNNAFLNYRIPAAFAPNYMIAPYWDDLQTSEFEQGVWARYDWMNHLYIVEWRAQGDNYFDTWLRFEVILYDPEYNPTRDGNGMLKIQYQNVELNLMDPNESGPQGCTVGIQGGPGESGLQYLFQDEYSAGAAAIDSGRAILLTTDGPPPRDTIDVSFPIPEVPQTTQLLPNYPNPFNSSTVIRYELAEHSPVKLSIFNLLGQNVITLVDRTQSAGRYEILWNGHNQAGISVPSGVYVYNIESGEFFQSKKLILIR
jgi:hypothetical protein